MSNESYFRPFEDTSIFNMPFEHFYQYTDKEYISIRGE